MSTRNIPNTLSYSGESLQAFTNPSNLQHEIIIQAEKILAHSAADYRSSPDIDNSIYTGHAGIALLFYHLHLVAPTIKIAGDTPLDLCLQYLSPALSAIAGTTKKPTKLGSNTKPQHLHCAFLTSAVGTLALAVVVYAQALRKFDLAKANMEILISHYGAVAAHHNGNVPSNELLYGRAGYLYAIRFVQTYCNGLSEITDLIDKGLVKTVFKLIIDEGYTHANQIKPVLASEPQFKETQLMKFMWNWHGQEYLGAAHGVCE
jgi:hypothetical protein